MCRASAACRTNRERAREKANNTCNANGYSRHDSHCCILTAARLRTITSVRVQNFLQLSLGERERAQPKNCRCCSERARREDHIYNTPPSVSFSAALPSCEQRAMLPCTRSVCTRFGQSQIVREASNKWVGRSSHQPALPKHAFN